MEQTSPIEVAIEPLRRLVAPEPLEEILEELKKEGLITHFIVRTKTLLIWTEFRRKFELAMFTETAKCFEPTAIKPRKN